MTEKRKVTYYCQDKECGKPFEADQGSRVRFCPECLVKRVTGNKKRG